MMGESPDDLFSKYRSVIENIRQWAAQRPYILGIFVYGSFARGSQDNFSDIDMAIVLGNLSYREDMVEEFRKHLDAKFEVPKDDKIIFYLDDPYLKIELSIADEAGFYVMEKVFRGSRIENPGRSVIFDRYGKLTEMIRTWSVREGTTAKLSEIQNEAFSFMYYYEGFHAQFHRGDSYRAFFQYSLAYFKLCSFMWAVNGNADFLYSPSKLFHYLPADKVEKLKRVSPSLNIKELGIKKEMMYDIFVQELSATNPILGLTKSYVEDFRKNVVSSFPELWRLRDVSVSGDMKRGILYRSTNFKYYPKDSLQQWLSKYKILTVFDFRLDSEVEKGGYSPSEFQFEKYVRLPIDTAKNLPGASQLDPKSLHSLYHNFLGNQDLQNALLSIFSTIAKEGNTPALFHCWAGVDRTGVVAAIIQSLSGIPRPLVVADYVFSGGHAKQEYIEILLCELENRGGVYAYLHDIGMSDRLLNTISNLIKTNQEITHET